MVGASKILTVSYGTFSCTLEGFEEPFSTMKAIAEYFRDLAAEDRYFGAEPPTPDAEMLHRIAEREIQRRVEAKISENGITLRPREEAAEAAPARGNTTLGSAVAANGREVVAERKEPAASPAAPVAAEEPDYDDEFTIEAELSGNPIVPQMDDETAADEAENDSIAAKLLRIRAVVAAAKTETPVAAEQPGDDAATFEEDEAENIAQATHDAEDDFSFDLDLGDSPARDRIEEPGAMVSEADMHEADDAAETETTVAAVEEDTAEETTEPADLAGADTETPTAAEDIVEFDAAEEEFEPEADEATEAVAEHDIETADADEEIEAAAEEEMATETATLDKADAAREILTDLPEADEAPETATEDDRDAFLAKFMKDADATEFEVEETPPIAEPAEDTAEDESPLSRILAAEDTSTEEEVAADSHSEEAYDEEYETDGLVASGDDEEENAEFVDNLPDNLDEDSLEAAFASEESDDAEEVAAEALDLSAWRVADEDLRADETTDEVAEVEQMAEAAFLDTEGSEPEVARTGLLHRAARVITMRTSRKSDAQSEDMAADEPADTDVDATDEAEDDALLSDIGAAIGETGLESDEEATLLRELADVARESRRGVHEGRAILENNASDEETSVERLMEEAKSKLEGDENRRRFSAISHLKAAVAATVADRKLKLREAPAETGESAATELDRYRDDLSKAVRPRRPAAESSASTQRPTMDNRPAPLVLVSEQRIDKSEEANEDAAIIRPRRINTDALAEEAEDELDDLDTACLSPEEADSFAEFAERLGANDLSELLEAAAAYTATVEGQPHFSRPQILRKVARVSEDDDFDREEGMRSFGMLLRQGKIQKISRGQFRITESSRFVSEAKSAAR